VAPRALILPGLYNSGPQHWQSHWEAADPSFQRLHQDDWETPALADWLQRLDPAVKASGLDVVLVAHSSACILAAAWGALPGRRVRAALLVGPSDSEAPSYPIGPRGFAPMPRARLGFPSIVVASSNDEYVTLERAEEFARCWGSRFVPVGPLGHINSASNIGDWPAGRALLEELLA
jgi:predicted alpha/beta hydrolase family esterase